MNDSPNRDVVVFTEAVHLPAGERAAYLERACAGDAKLRQRVEALLQTHDQVGDFLEQPPRQAVMEARPGASAGEKPGDRIGRYKLLQQIGEGGCGVVYMAEQEEPVRRRVALKIIKPGLDTKSVIARFEAERQALALMDHPNIAKILDAGATGTGRPYFVMELVRGIKITEYCDQNSLTTEERLNLFIQVCQAVQHAHQKGVIHRDIKPSNILVTKTLEGAALPVVIDFGIAKATTNQRLTDKTLFTAFEMLIGTPAYMSPEQAALTSVDVDTRTDIYSLGVLLYELLTGSTPFDTGELLKAGLDEVRRVIREQEPVRPSTRLSRLTGEDLTNVAQHRKSEPPKLIRAVCGDLDWIAMKALEKDRTRRYETANGLALDIQRFLADETISARPPGTIYKFQKMVLRNKLLFCSIGLIAILLLVSLVAVTASLAKEKQSRRAAETEKQTAQTEAAKSRQITLFLEDMLRGVGPSVALGRDTSLLQEILDKTGARIGKELTNQPAVAAELRSLMGQIYQELGRYDQAEIMDRAALAGYRDLFGNESKQVAASLSHLSMVLQQKGKPVAAETLVREALAVRRKLFGPESPEVAASLKDLAGTLWKQGKWAEAAALNQQSLEMRRKLLGAESLEVADSINFQVMVLLQQGRFQEAEAAEREVLAMRRKFLGEEDLLVIGTRFNLSIILGAEDKLAEAEELARKVLALWRRLLGDGHRDVASCLSYLGIWLQKAGRAAEAEAALRETVSIQRKALGDEHPDTILSLNNLGLVLESLSKLAEAEVLDREVLALRRKIHGAEHSDVASSLQTLARVLQSEGKFAEAEPLSREALALQRKLLGDEHPQTIDSLNILIGLLMSEKKLIEAEQLLNESLTPAFVAKAQSAPLLSARANLLARGSRWGAAAADLAAAIEHRPTDHQFYHMLAPVLVQAGNLDAYQQLCQKILGRFGGTTNPMVADQMAKDCLLLPSAGADLQRVDQMADTAVTAGKDLGAITFFQCCKALAEYRQGHFASAIAWAQKSLAGRPHLYAQTEAYPVLAMAHHQLKQKAEALAALNEGTALANGKLPKRDSDDLGADWQGWIFAQVLMDEATALIQPAATT
jgi:serine/threonine protein kinase/tetratricopeptide (TPR) repeat protein